jgi:hypothetical protein
LRAAGCQSALFHHFLSCYVCREITAGASLVACRSVFFGCWSEQIIELSGGIFQQTMFDCQRVKSAKDGRKVKIQDLPETFPDDRA